MKFGLLNFLFEAYYTAHIRKPIRNFMRKIHQTALFFAIILIEGYVVLSSEMLAIRQTIPFIGSGTDTVSIIIAAVLMPLAFGYQAGGAFKPHRFLGFYISIRKKLIANIVIAALILLPALSYRFLYVFFPFIYDLGIEDRLLQTFVYSVLFLVAPVYLLGQTVPLISNYFAKEHLPKVTGKFLFISTIGSFLGAVFSTLVLMATIGAHHTTTLNFLLLTILVIALSKRKFSASVKMMIIIFIAAICVNSNYIMRGLKVIKNNQYAIIAVARNNGYNHLFINHNYSSKYNPKTGGKHNYIEFAERVAIHPIMTTGAPKEILVIGAGGFTFGHEDKKNRYTYIDINGDLKEVAEQRILKAPIGDNKQFIAKPARAFLSQNEQKYDVIYLDAYLGGISIPEHLVTQEFFLKVKDVLNDKGVLIANFIVSPNFNNTFTKSIDNSFRSAFRHYSRHAIDDVYLPWNEDKAAGTNIAYVYKHYADDVGGTIFVDPKDSGD